MSSDWQAEQERAHLASRASDQQGDYLDALRKELARAPDRRDEIQAEIDRVEAARNPAPAPAVEAGPGTAPYTSAEAQL